MSVTFSAAKPRSSIDCGICLQPLTNDVVCHDNVHFLHKKCQDAWETYHNSCPICRAPTYDSDLDTATIFLSTCGGVSSGLIANLLFFHQNLNPALSGPAGAVMGVAIGKLMCNSWASSNVRAITASSISFIAPIMTTYIASHYF